MQRRRSTLLGFGLIALLMLSLTPLRAQEMREAVELYNNAAKNFQKEPQQAQSELYKCIEICKELPTDEAEKLRGQAEKLIPRTQFEIARALYAQKKTKESIAAMEKARQLAEEFNDGGTIKRVDKTIPQIFYAEGIALNRTGEYRKAVDMFSRAIAANARYMDPFIAKAISLDSLRAYDEMIETLEEGIRAARLSSNMPREMDMRVMALNYLKPLGKKLQDEKQLDESIATFQRAAQIDERDAEIFQALAIAYMDKNQADSALINADRAIEVASGTMDKTQLFFLKAQAHQKLGEKDLACAAYREAAHGEFKEKAEHEMKNTLKCE